MVTLTSTEMAFTVLMIAGFSGFLAFQIGYTFGSIAEKSKVLKYSFTNTMNLVEEMIRDLYPLEIKNK